MTHVRTSPYYPQSNGKLERYHRTLKSDCIRPKCPLTLEDAKRVVTQFVNDYNDRRLHSAIGYITPSDMLAGKQKEIHEARDRKLEEAREARSKIRAQQTAARYAKRTRPENRAMLGSNPLAEATLRRVDAEGKCNGRGGRESPARHLPLAFGHNAINPGGWGQSHQDAHPLSVRSITKLNLTTVYATYAGPKHFIDFVGRDAIDQDEPYVFAGEFTMKVNDG